MENRLSPDLEDYASPSASDDGEAAPPSLADESNAGEAPVPEMEVPADNSDAEGNVESPDNSAPPVNPEVEAARLEEEARKAEEEAARLEEQERLRVEARQQQEAAAQAAAAANRAPPPRPANPMPRPTDFPEQGANRIISPEEQRENILALVRAGLIPADQLSDHGVEFPQPKKKPTRYKDWVAKVGRSKVWGVVKHLVGTGFNS